METAASSSNSKLPAFLMILAKDHQLLQKQQQNLLTQRMFETFQNLKQKD